MKLASLKNNSRDGSLIVVSKDLSKYVKADHIAPTLQAALDDWSETSLKLKELSEQLKNNQIKVLDLDLQNCMSPLPRAYQWADGSAYINHVELVRKARNAEVPESFYQDPLMYQGGSDNFLSPYCSIPLKDEKWGCDFEGEIAVIVDDVLMGTSEKNATNHIKLVMLCNDISLRNLIPSELQKGFGFFNSKPSSAFSPIAVTPDELGSLWQDSLVEQQIVINLNSEPFGRVWAHKDATFNLSELVSHACKTRNLSAGTIIGSGTISNKDSNGGPGKPISDGGLGYSCIAEVRVVEKLLFDEIKTPFLKPGDRVQIDMYDENGTSIFGCIDQTVIKA